MHCPALPAGCTKSSATVKCEAFSMKAFRVLFGLLFVISAAGFAACQQSLAEIPQGMEALRHEASSKTEFTLDHSMLILASKLDSDNEDLRRVIAGVSGL